MIFPRRTTRSYLYVTPDQTLHGQVVDRRFIPFPQVAGVDPASFAAAGQCALLGTVVDTNPSRRLVLTLLATDTAPPGYPCTLDELWNDARGPSAGKDIKFMKGASRTKLRNLVMGGVGGVAVQLAGTTFDGRLERIAEAFARAARVATLVPQPGNSFDEHALAVDVEGVGTIGMIPKTFNQTIVRSGDVEIVRMQPFTKDGVELWSVTVRATPI